jgi:hypothetical protein
MCRLPHVATVLALASGLAALVIGCGSSKQQRADGSGAAGMAGDVGATGGTGGLAGSSGPAGGAGVVSGQGGSEGGAGGTAGGGGAGGDGPAGDGGNGASSGYGGAIAGSGGATGGNGGVSGKCTSGAVKCVGEDVYACNFEGAWVLQQSCIGEGPHCVTSGSIALCGCLEGTLGCGTDSNPTRCNAAGTWDLQPACSGVQICTNGVCGLTCAPTRPPDCANSTTARTCVDGTIVPFQCSVGQVCTQGRCVPNTT